MSDPWDAPPLPTAGDLNPDHTYTGVGRIMSAWETIEFELCMLHSVFSGDPGGEAMRLYGAKRNFPGRLDDLARTGASYFVAKPNQQKEGQFQSLIDEVRKYADRRNEVAHGIVLPITRFKFFREHLTRQEIDPPQYAVIPPYHMERSHGTDGLPLYAYTRNTLATLLEKLKALWLRLVAYRDALP